MPKPKKIDLNKYEKVAEVIDLEDYTSIIITPFKLADGTQPPDLYFRKGIKKVPDIENVDDVEWYQDIHISKEGTDEEYAYRVNWWFRNAIGTLVEGRYEGGNVDYKNYINGMFNKNGFNIRQEIERAHAYLFKFNYSARKTYIHKYLKNWLINGYSRYTRTKR